MPLKKKDCHTPNDDFRSLFKTHPSPMWVYDPHSLAFLIVNDAAIALYGYDSDAYANMTVLDIRPEAERRRMLDAVRTRTDVERAERWTHLKAGGKTFEVLTYGREVRFDGRDAILAIVQDRTEVNAAHRQVNDTRSLLDSIVENLPVGVFVKDMEEDGRYILFNESCGAIVGRDAARIIWQTNRAVFPAGQREQFRMQDADAFAAGGATIVFEETMTDLSGSKRILRTAKKALRSHAGSPSRYLLGISQDVTDERSVESRLAHMAMHDPLTGLRNRAYFADYMHRQARIAKIEKPLALLYSDVDHFKNVNDNKGHAGGDQLLCQIACRLTRLAGPDDLVVRLGGDEFALVLQPAARDRVEATAQAFLGMMSKPFELDGQPENVTCSIGIAIAPQHAPDKDVLMRHADLALYAAKEAGRATYRFYETEMRLEAERRHLLTTELREALEKHQFELYYQPIVSLLGNEIGGFEALIRWRHPQRGLISPNEFIPLAQDIGLIVPIGEWVLREATRAAAFWPAHLKIAVNLSVRQFRHAGLLSTIVAALDQSGLLPNRLEIEVTESVFLADVDQSLPLLKALKELGIRIAIDDFGTGYSSFSYLRAFDFDKIKLDRSFVSGVEHDPGCLAIVRAVAGIGQGFNATTLAEGIETEAQLARVKTEGFSEVQGYLLGRPMPRQDVEDLIFGPLPLKAARR